MIISLAGYMGSGKSHIAKSLSTILNYTLIDLDKEIVLGQKMSVAEIFEKKGEIYFRKIEREVLQGLLNRKDNIILSLGGGTPVYYNNIELINQYSESVYLQANIPTLTDRLLPNKAKRPLIARIEDQDLPEFIAKHLFERIPYYSQCKHIVITDKKTADQVVQEIINLLPLD